MALHWLAREDEGVLSPQDQAAFKDWLDQDPEHRRVYEAVREAVCAPNRHSAHPDLMTLRQAALASAPDPAPRISVWAGGAAAAAVAAVSILGLGWFGLRPNVEPSVSGVEAVARLAAPAIDPGVAIYRTRIGERASFRLPDDSLVTLNTDTVVKIAFSDGERAVRLVRGQALFEVAKDPRRRFRVYAADQQITAIGTTFDVRLDGGKVKVALVEGVVDVTRGSAKAGPDIPIQRVTMSAGEILSSTPATAIRVEAGDAAGEADWRSGLVSFNATPLAEAVAEIDRYTTRPLVLADPALGDLRITGVFRTGDPERFARQVAEVLPIEVQSTGREIRLVAEPGVSQDVR